MVLRGGRSAKEKLCQPEYSAGAESGKKRRYSQGEKVRGDAGELKISHEQHKIL